MFANFMIGLREGLEAALVVGILIAYLVKSGRREQTAPVWIGVALAAGASLAFGAFLTFTSQTLSDRASEMFEGVTSLLAVAFVTWMIFWMRRQARHLRSDLHGKVDDALGRGAVALGLVAFLAVAREGLETALFLWPAVRSAGAGSTPVVGATAGLVTAALVGWLLYRRAVTIDLARFFRFSGLALIVIAAGVLSYGVHELQEASVLPGEDALAFDVRGTVAPDSTAGHLLAGTLSLRPKMAWLEVGAWFGYLIPTTALFLRPTSAAGSTRRRRDGEAAPELVGATGSG